MKKPVIEFKDFSFKYKVQAKPTLKNINLSIYEGEKVLIVGPSGSGKSTLSNAINGLVPFKYEGEITGSLKINGKETKDLSIAKLSDMVGTVLQDPDGQFIGLTVGEDIAFKLENECVPLEAMREKVIDAARMVNIKEHLTSSPQRLSGGQKQRVSLAGVIAAKSDILLFDEPLASLDPATGNRAIELIDKIKKESDKTVIIIEHRLEEVLHCHVDRIIVMSNGQIVSDCPPCELLCSDVLRENGIREPLYLTALKYAGCTIDKDMNPEDVNELNYDRYTEEIHRWFNNINDIEKKIDQDTILEVKNISFRYNNKRETLKNVSFKIKKGEMVSIIGRNGAGKSTISKLICGFYKPLEGSILFEGRDIKDDSIKERAEKIGMVMQNPNQMICKTMIFDEVAFGLKIRNYSEEEIKKRVYETLKICGLYEFRNWPISALSFGQKKRVTIASILAINPEVIILDEPTAGQDFKHYTEIMEFLKELNQKGVAIIMITHDMHLMLEYTDRAIVLADGMKLKDDITAEILTDEEVIRKANLRETSLYTLAVNAGIEEPRKFVRKFIEEDRRIRR
ncbi:ABC transporter ATP-binding protein [uncultured Clostridium sp.]|uniref:ABC transporter ATP-binding protein n=1 Tax=uncultured Clostridium sp. TaxID=59620 RepID=UPI0025D3D47F|nr:ABC transporter ATP-binding protein [uncultured Clostridium sp.]